MIKGIPVYIFAAALLIILALTFWFSVRASETNHNQNTQVSQTQSRHSIKVESLRSVEKDPNTKIAIVEVTIIADSQCSTTQPQCAFYRNRFQLIDANGQIFPPAGPPIFYIQNFQYRELVSSRPLAKNQAETGQLYFVVPNTINYATLKYEGAIVSTNIDLSVK